MSKLSLLVHQIYTLATLSESCLRMSSRILFNSRALRSTLFTFTDVNFESACQSAYELTEAFRSFDKCINPIWLLDNWSLSESRSEFGGLQWWVREQSERPRRSPCSDPPTAYTRTKQTGAQWSVNLHRELRPHISW